MRTKLQREPAILIGFLATVVGEVASVLTVGMKVGAMVLAALPVISAAVIRWFVAAVPPERRGLK